MQKSLKIGKCATIYIKEIEMHERRKLFEFVEVLLCDEEVELAWLCLQRQQIEVSRTV